MSATPEKITIGDALRFVEGLANPGEPWLVHSRKVAEAAGRIAVALRSSGVPLDVEEITAMALFHDVGRSLDHGHLHGWSGFKILKDAGLCDYARTCVSHWLKGRSVEVVLDESEFLEEDFVRSVFKEAGVSEFTLADKIVSLADSMTRLDEITTVADRYAEARTRYGDSQWMRTNERISLEIKNEFDAIIGRDIYELFPEIKKKRR
jgi:HD superfamily phosphohydrolase YqeK